IKAESSFSPTALSPVGAVGLMQLMPATAAIVLDGKGNKGGADRLTRPEVNIRAGVKHLKDLLALYDGNPVAAIAAYNAGAGNVNKWRKRFGALPPDQFIESIPFGETREYVKRVLATADIYNRLYHIGRPISFSQLATSPDTASSRVTSAAPAMESRLAAGTSPDISN
ncbi:MAG TPA: lytic transglycosylase domain-containing protein, partial [Geobacteraceae bacterium]